MRIEITGNHIRDTDEMMEANDLDSSGWSLLSPSSWFREPTFEELRYQKELTRAKHDTAVDNARFGI